MLEGNILNVYSKECTVEFQPGADMSWQSWAANELNQAATYPSPYANVHKGNMGTMGGTIGVNESDTWQPFSMAKRISLIEKVSNSPPLFNLTFASKARILKSCSSWLKMVSSS